MNMTLTVLEFNDPIAAAFAFLIGILTGLAVVPVRGLNDDDIDDEDDEDDADDSEDDDDDTRRRTTIPSLSHRSSAFVLRVFGSANEIPLTDCHAQASAQRLRHCCNSLASSSSSYY